MRELGLGLATSEMLRSMPQSPRGPMRRGGAEPQGLRIGDLLHSIRRALAEATRQSPLETLPRTHRYPY